MSVELKKERHFEIIGRTFFRDDSTALVLKQSYYFYSCCRVITLFYKLKMLKLAKITTHIHTYTVSLAQRKDLARSIIFSGGSLWYAHFLLPFPSSFYPWRQC